MTEDIYHNPGGPFTVTAAQTDLRCYTDAQSDGLLREQFRRDGREFPSTGATSAEDGESFVKTVWFWAMISALSGTGRISSAVLC